MRKANGQCMYCGEPYDPTHPEKCKERVKPQTNALICNDLDQPLSEEVLNQLAVEDALTDEFLQLSLHAISGTETESCIKLRSLVKNKVMLTLVDSCSTASFVSAAFLHKLGISATRCTPVQVRVANGQEVISDTMVCGLEWWCQGYTFNTDMRVC
jgi:hypothetical protein